MSTYSYLASIEVDQRQRLIAQADKLREMLGASRLIQRSIEVTKEVLDRPAYRSNIALVQEVSGVLRVTALDLPILGSFLWAVREKLFNELHLSATFALVATQGDLDKDVVALEQQVRRLKDAKAGADGRPCSPWFAQCSIQPNLPANGWFPDELESRRRLVSTQASARHQIAQQTYVKLFDGFDFGDAGKRDGTLRLARCPMEFKHLVASLSDSYIAFLKADGDGMGRLLSQLKWKVLDQELKCPKGEGEAMLRFSRAVDHCLHEALKSAVNKVTKDRWDTKNGTFPVAPIVVAGEDFWILCRRDLALPLAIELIKSYATLAAGNDVLKKALQQTAGAGTECLTVSCGILFVKQGFPFEAQLHMAEELIRSAKLRRTDLKRAEKQGCLDYHWLESSARESVEECRSTGLRIADNGKQFSLHTRPWTCAEADAILTAVHALHGAGVARRKLAQLDRILRYGDKLSDLAYRQWLNHLESHERQAIDAAMAAVPGNWRTVARIEPCSSDHASAGTD